MTFELNVVNADRSWARDLMAQLLFSMGRSVTF